MRQSASAAAIIEARRQDYNHHRLHSGLGDLTSIDYTKKQREALEPLEGSAPRSFAKPKTEIKPRTELTIK